MITLQFVASDDLGSEAIKLFERGWPSHVNARLPDGTLLGALLDGVKIRPANYAAWSRVQEVTLSADNDTTLAFLDFLHKQVGKPYDKLAICAFPVQRDWRASDSWFCSELIAAALESCGWFKKPLADPANEITPRDLLLLTSPWAV